MAYIDQAKKQVLVAAVKKNLAKVLGDQKLKVTFSVRNHSTICATIQSGTIDFGKATGVNHYYIKDHFDGLVRDILLAIKDGLMSDYYDHSDIQSDYFNCSHYIDIKIGSWDKPYILEK
jgi:hypothetical protein